MFLILACVYFVMMLGGFFLLAKPADWVEPQSVGEKPKIWMACGTEDSLYPANEEFAKKLKELGYSVKWSKWKGKHDWIFWQECIVRFIPWLPLAQGEAGRSSGNVGV